MEVPEIHADVGVFISRGHRSLEVCLGGNDDFPLGKPLFNLFFVEIVLVEFADVLGDAAASGAVFVECEIATVMV